MHWVDRGPEPSGLGTIRSTYTPHWIQFYTAGIGKRPTDAYWRNFRYELEIVFHGLCAYCEEYAKGEVDHFKPKSKFPDLVYSWTNWLFVCHVCNHSKLDAWPDDGYVDPCSIAEIDRPENYFDFDTTTGFIVPNKNLPPPSRLKAQSTIDDLGLNAFHHLRYRAAILELLRAALPHDSSSLTISDMMTCKRVGSRERPISSLIRAWLSEQGFPTG